ncbi:RNA polymerase sigma factor [Paenibacillus sp. 1011MAR3C5]|uniref:RNA polymerase sigma factor n=1 Tax=Paenibacillus sp. 1011MAR3C5 TaxID=1675787 RepID=UPI0016030856|nr:RNA polymerase sigma factor [Paenibacillus sp. 1011MAR3C5]
MKEIVIGASLHKEDNESELIERAKSGDQDAFSELVRRHRAKAHNWAYGLAQDSYLAEDIVQEALMKAFVHLGTLVDVTRFLPWLHRIVRNQAMMKLRRGGPYRHEQPFTSLARRSYSDQVDWEDVESIMTYMMSVRLQEEGSTSNPEEQIVRQETMETILNLFTCLKPRERGIFEAYFFRQLSPQEIAALFDMTMSSVYKSIARTRQKLQDERIRVYIQEHLTRRRDEKASSSKMLERPNIYTQRIGDSHFLGARPSVTYCLWGMLQYTDQKNLSLAEVNALTGQAFSLHIIKETVHIGGPFTLAGEPSFHQLLTNLGHEFKVLTYLPAQPNTITDVIQTVHRSIDRGIPVIVWDLFHAEYGMVYGYDDHEQKLTALDKLQEGEVPYEQIGKGKTSEIGLIAFQKDRPIDRKMALLRLLDAILEQGYTEELRSSGDGELVRGLAAFDAWMEAFRGDRIVPFFNAYNAAVYAELRGFARDFLYGLLNETDFEQDRELLESAWTCYKLTAHALNELSILFPFPMGGDPKSEQSVEKAISLLQQAKEAEQDGFIVLAKWRDRLKG